jgi:YHS domain-containing protein
MFKVLATSLLAGAVCVSGCAGGRSYGGYDPDTHLWRTSHGVKAEDRVNGELVDPNSAIKRLYQGETYYFENDFDTAMFERDPGVYAYSGYAPFYASP